MKHKGGSIVLWECSVEKRIHALQKVDGIMRMEDYLEILKQHLKILAKKLKLGFK